VDIVEDIVVVVLDKQIFLVVIVDVSVGSVVVD